MLHVRWLITTAATLFVAGSPLHAEWYEASSEHFVVYADDSPKDIQSFAELLEKYNAALQLVTTRSVAVPSPSNRVTIYVAGSGKEIRNLAGDKDGIIAGFYIPRAGGSVAFVQNIRLTKGYPDFSTVVLLHEYAHHFLISSSRYALPRWLNEGAAEFFASTMFPKDGSVQVGLPALHRGGDLFYSQEVTVYELFDDELYRSKKRAKYDAYYGRSWLLYHYLMFSAERQGQLSKYLQSLLHGENPNEAARRAFGDLDQLERELDKYLKKSRWSHLEIGPGKIRINPVQIRQLSAGEAAVMPLVIRSERGVDEEQAAELVIELRQVAAKYPQDPAVQTALAEGEFDAGNYDAAITAAKQAISIDPRARNAYVQMGYALFAKAGETDDREAAYRAAMVPFSKLNALENDHPLPLIYYYRSFTERGATPSENARHALERASELAPFDQGLATNLGTMFAREGKIALAISVLKPIAANPHGGGLANFAQNMIDAMVNAPEGEPFHPNFILGQDSSTEGPADDEVNKSADR